MRTRVVAFCALLIVIVVPCAAARSTCEPAFVPDTAVVLRPADGLRTVAAAQAGLSPAAPDAQDSRKAPDAEGSDADLKTLFSLYQPYLVNIGAYEPMYFLLGVDPEDSKFQISFQYQFVGESSEWGQRHPWLQGIRFGYTQTSFWDLESSSAPFEDTSYKPECFFLSDNIDARPPWVRGFFVQAGFQHESNGRGGEFSRSTNLLYLKPIFVLYDDPSRLGIQVAPRFWIDVATDDRNNPDLNDYRGYAQLELKAGRADGIVAAAVLGWAAAGGSLVLDVTFPLHRLFSRKLDLFFQVQYVNALAESLIAFRERTEALRFGFGIVR